MVKKEWTNNEVVEAMHDNTAKAFKKIADYVKVQNYSSKQIIDFLYEMSDELEAQAKLVALRDELKFTKPNK